MHIASSLPNRFGQSSGPIVWKHYSPPMQGNPDLSEKPLKIALVVPDLHKESSGISPAIIHFANAIAAAGAQVTLHALQPTPAPLPTLDPAVTLRVHTRSPLLWRLGRSPEMAIALKKAAIEEDIVHNHSLWMLPNIYPGWYCRQSRGAKLVVSPHGTLSRQALSRSRWRKRLVWWLPGQRMLFKNAVLFHATSEAEVADIRRTGFTGPVALLPNGIHVPEQSEKTPISNSSMRTLLFLSRIHPMKGLDKLLHAWQGLQHRHPDWQLLIAGPLNSDYARQMQTLADKLTLQRCSFTGEMKGETKASAYINASLLVLPSHSENFGLVVAEALAQGTPVLTTTGTPWQGLEQHSCGWWVAPEQQSLENALDKAMRLDESSLQAMGQRGREWMSRDFEWKTIGERMCRVYLWLLGHGPKPSCIVDTQVSHPR